MAKSCSQPVNLPGSRPLMDPLDTTSHVNHEERVVWFSISMHLCGYVPMVVVLWLAALWTTRAPLSCTEDWQAWCLLTSITWSLWAQV